MLPAVPAMSRIRNGLAILALGALAGVYKNLGWSGKQIASIPAAISTSPSRLSLDSPSSEIEMPSRGHHENNYSPTIDIISVGSETRPEYQKMQKATFGSHPSVRHFFAITEQDDVDQDCHDRLTMLDVLQISGFCGGLRRDIEHKHRLLFDFKNKFANPDWLQRTTKNPPGWMCAQKRPMAGFGRALKAYRQHTHQTGQQPQELDLPDFLVIMDDDTWYNMEHVANGLKELQEEAFLSDSGLGTSFVVAGCLIRSKLKRFKWSFPFGGWGTIFSRGALEAMLEPLYCDDMVSTNNIAVNMESYVENSNSTSYYSSLFCPKLAKDRIGELKTYRDGMSLADIMYNYVMREPYLDHTNWDVGFCMHSDWVWGCKSRFWAFFSTKMATQDLLHLFSLTSMKAPACSHILSLLLSFRYGQLLQHLRRYGSQKQ